MNSNSIRPSSNTIVPIALLAGLAGGVAEMIWIAGYCAVTPLQGSEVLRQISLSAGLDFGSGLLAPICGIAIHLGLSVLLGLVFALSVWRLPVLRSSVVGSLLASCAVLCVIWAVNFLVVLPSLNPGFVHLMPYGVGLVSKLLFGVAMGWILYQGEHQGHRATIARAMSVA